MTFFNHRPYFSDFFTVCNVIYDDPFDPFFTRKSPISENNSLITPFLLSRASDKHYFSKYWGGRMHGPSPPQILWGLPPVPPRFTGILRDLRDVYRAQNISKEEGHYTDDGSSYAI